METFSLEIITPERKVFDDQIEMVTVDTAMGRIGILPQHVPLFANLVAGEVKITKAGKEYFLAIGKGFVMVTRDKTSVLVSEAYKAEELNEEEIIKARTRALEAIKNKPQDISMETAQASFARSNLALKVLNRHRKISHNL